MGPRLGLGHCRGVPCCHPGEHSKSWTRLRWPQYSTNLAPQGYQTGQIGMQHP